MEGKMMYGTYEDLHCRLDPVVLILAITVIIQAILQNKILREV